MCKGPAVGINSSYSKPKIKMCFKEPKGQCLQRNEKSRAEWERLEISSRKLGISREYFMQGWAQ